MCHSYIGCHLISLQVLVPLSNCYCIMKLVTVKQSLALLTTIMQNLILLYKEYSCGDFSLMAGSMKYPIIGWLNWLLRR